MNAKGFGIKAKRADGLESIPLSGPNTTREDFECILPAMQLRAKQQGRGVEYSIIPVVFIDGKVDFAHDGRSKAHASQDKWRAAFAGR